MTVPEIPSRSADSRYALAEASPVVVWTTDAAGFCTYINARWTEWTGQASDEALGLGWLDAVHPDDRLGIREQFLAANQRAEPFELEYRLRHADGSYVWALDYARPDVDQQGRFLGYVGVVVPIARRKAAETALVDSERRLKIALRAGGLGVHDYDIVGDRITWDPIIYDLWGLAHGTPITVDIFLAGVHPEDRERLRREVTALLTPDGPRQFQSEYRLARLGDGRTIWVHADGEVQYKDGRPVRLIGTVRDISERMAQREQIEHLMREVNHRSKNLLSVVQAIARQTAATTDVASFLRTLDERLVSLSASHDLLLAHDWSAVSVRALVLRQLGHVDGAGRRFQIDGGDVAAGPRAAQALGMAIHELATNAMKYGALATADGLVHISWALVDGPDASRFTMNWTETGGPAVVPPPRAGYGRTVIERMTAMALDGTSMLTFAATGVIWRLDVPARSLAG